MGDKLSFSFTRQATNEFFSNLNTLNDKNLTAANASR